MPARIKKARQNKKLKPGSDTIRNGLKGCFKIVPRDLFDFRLIHIVMPLLRFRKTTFVLRPALNNFSADAGYRRGAEAPTPQEIWQHGYSRRCLNEAS
jgi:hypothetical protein